MCGAARSQATRPATPDSRGLGNFRGRRPVKVQLLSILYKSHKQATAINAHKNETRSRHLSSNQFAKLSHFEE
jgi:hypothetical protein